MMVYSISSWDSFSEIKTLFQTILAATHLDVPVVLVGNKCDQHEKRAVPVYDGYKLAKELGCLFQETSAKNDADVKMLVCDLLRPLTLPTLAQGNSDVTGRGDNAECNLSGYCPCM
ncbi:P-loop containing nucleoside triphosphate hydrolase protein [Xylariaceae sp. FL0016]|nr:P-loop containing nucleoside triphosphate hydrolase protein [Xylariaceae sp. FL0016]